MNYSRYASASGKFNFYLSIVYYPVSIGYIYYTVQNLGGILGRVEYFRSLAKDGAKKLTPPFPLLLFVPVDNIHYLSFINTRIIMLQSHTRLSSASIPIDQG